MFTWICPQCGREVPPSYSECPSCAENRQRAEQGLPPVGAEAAPPAWQPAPPPAAPQYPPQPPPQCPPQQTAYYPAQAPPQQYAPPQPPPQQQWQATPVPPQPTYTLPGTARGKGLPSWLITILVAAVAVGVIYGAVRLFGSKGSAGSSAATASQAQTATAVDASNPYAKFLEVTGVRIVEDEKKRAKAQFLVVNHSTADLPDQELQVSLSTTTAKPGDEPLAVFTVKTGPLPANGFKDVSAPLKTKMRAYELPDWQFLKVSFAIAGSH